MKKHIIIIFFFFRLSLFSQIQPLGQVIEFDSTTNVINEFAINADGSIIAVGVRDSIDYVRIFHLEAGQWVRYGNDITTPYPSNTQVFGTGIALNGTGNILTITGYNGSDEFVATYRYDNGQWTRTGQIIQNDLSVFFMNNPLALNYDGTVLAVGMKESSRHFDSSSVNMYKWINNQWQEIQHLNVVYDDNRENYLRIDLDSSGNRLIIHNKDIYTFNYANGNWNASNQLIISDTTVSGTIMPDAHMSKDGTRLGIIYKKKVRRNGQTKYYPMYKIFRMENGQWVPEGNEIAGEELSERTPYYCRIDLNAPGDKIIISNPYNYGHGLNSGMAKMYRQVNGRWTEWGGTVSGHSANENFGRQVKMDYSGNKIFISNSIPKQIYAYDVENMVNNTKLGREFLGETRAEALGHAVDINRQGNIIAYSAPGYEIPNNNDLDRGVVRVYEFVNRTWQLKGQPVYGRDVYSGFGQYVDLNDAGNIFASSGVQYRRNENKWYVEVYAFQNGQWVQKGQTLVCDTSNMALGYLLRINADGTRLTVVTEAFAWNRYKVGYYTLQNNVWTLTAPEHEFSGGKIADISEDGNVILFTDRNVWKVYENVSGNWVRKGSDIPVNSDYAAISGDGNTVLIQQLSDDNGTESNKMTAYEFDGTDWVQKGQELWGSIPYGRFGFSMSVNYDGNIIGGGYNVDDFEILPPESEGVCMQLFEFNNGRWRQVGNDIQGYQNITTGMKLSGIGHVVIGANEVFQDSIQNTLGIVFTYELSQIDNSMEVENNITKASEENIIIYPNPNAGILYLSNFSTVPIEKIVIYDLSGKKLFSTSNIYPYVDVSFLSAGIYLLEIQMGGHLMTKRFILDK